jgi:alpha-glucosidase
MPWTQDGVSAGFSDTRAWLPVAEPHRLLAVDIQEHMPGSVLNVCRTFLAWRRRQPALQIGDIEFIEASAQTLTFLRSHDGERVLASFNLSGDSAAVAVPRAWNVEPCHGHGFAARMDGTQIELPPYQAFFGVIGN